MMNLGNKIKRLRVLHGLSQDDLALKLNITKSALGRIEHAEAQVDMEFVESFSKTIGMPVEDVINYDEKNVVNMIHNKINNGVVYQQSMVDSMQMVITNLQSVVNSQQKQIELQNNNILLITEALKQITLFFKK